MVRNRYRLADFASAGSAVSGATNAIEIGCFVFLNKFSIGTFFTTKGLCGGVWGNERIVKSSEMDMPPKSHSANVYAKIFKTSQKLLSNLLIKGNILI